MKFIYNLCYLYKITPYSNKFLNIFYTLYKNPFSKKLMYYFRGILLGQVGLLGGALGKKKSTYYCGKCGFSHEYNG